MSLHMTEGESLVRDKDYFITTYLKLIYITLFASLLNSWYEKFCVMHITINTVVWEIFGVKIFYTQCTKIKPLKYFYNE